MPYEFQCTRRVEFHETDMAGIVHFATFFIWMEETEHAFFRSLGLSVIQEQNGKLYTWPRVSVSCEYARPLRFEQSVEQHLRVVSKSSKSVTYEIAFSQDGHRCAVGKVTAVCCLYSSDRQLSSVEIPAFLSEKIEVAPQPDETVSR